jgi:hypothetical protein
MVQRPVAYPAVDGPDHGGDPDPNGLERGKDPADPEVEG